jgi:excisionase family DNA binding protein
MPRKTTKKPEPTTLTKQDYLRVPAVAELLGLTCSQIYALASERAIGHRRFGHSIFFTPQDVEEYIRRHTYKPLT